VFSFIDFRVLLTTAEETADVMMMMMMMHGGMEHVELQPLQQPVLRYEMRRMAYSPEDILLCVDADAEVNVVMKAVGGVKGFESPGRREAGARSVCPFQAAHASATPILSCHFEQQCSVGTLWWMPDFFPLLVVKKEFSLLDFDGVELQS
jgi:hypothetical protein